MRQIPTLSIAVLLMLLLSIFEMSPTSRLAPVHSSESKLEVLRHGAKHGTHRFISAADVK